MNQIWFLIKSDFMNFIECIIFINRKPKINNKFNLKNALIVSL